MSRRLRSMPLGLLCLALVVWLGTTARLWSLAGDHAVASTNTYAGGFALHCESPGW
jgi:hypothetical protein